MATLYTKTKFFTQNAETSGDKSKENVKDQKNTQELNQEELKNSLKNMKATVSKKILEVSKNSEDAAQKYKELENTILKALVGEDKAKGMTIDQLQDIDAINTPKEIADKLKADEKFQGLMKDLALTEKDILKNLYVKGVPTVEKLRNKYKNSAMELMKYTDSLKTVKEEVRNDALDFGGNMLRGILGMTPGQASEKETLAFTQMFRPTSINAIMKGFSDSQSQYKNLGDWLKLAASQLTFKDTPGVEMFQKAISNEHREGFKNLFTKALEVKDKEKLLTMYSESKRFLNSMKNFTKEEKDSFQANEVDYATFKDTLEKKVKELEAVHHVVSACKGITESQKKIILEAMEKCSGQENAFNVAMVALFLIRTGGSIATAGLSEGMQNVVAGGSAAVNLLAKLVGLGGKVLGGEDTYVDPTVEKGATNTVDQTFENTESNEKLDNLKVAKNILEQTLAHITDKYFSTTFGQDNFLKKFGTKERAMQIFIKAIVVNSLDTVDPTAAQTVKDDKNFAQKTMMEAFDAYLGKNPAFMTSISTETGVKTLAASMSTLVNNAVNSTFRDTKRTTVSWNRELTGDTLLRDAELTSKDLNMDRAMQDEGKEVEHKALLEKFEIETKDKKLDIKDSLSKEGKELLKLMMILQHPEWDQAKNQREIAEALGRNGKNIIEVYGKLHEKHGEFKEHFENYKKLLELESETNSFSKVLSDTKKNELDAYYAIYNLSASEVGDLKNRFDTFQGQNILTVALAWVQMALEAGAVVKGAESLSKIMKNQDTMTKEAAKAAELLDDMRLPQEERVSRVSALATIAKREGWAENNMLLDGLTDRQIVKMEQWTEVEWKIAKEAKLLLDGTKIGPVDFILKDKVDDITKYAQYVNTEGKFTAMKLFGMEGFSNLQPLLQPKDLTTPMQQDPIKFAAYLVRNPAYADLCSTLLEKNAYSIAQSGLGLNVEEIARVLINKEMDVSMDLFKRFNELAAKATATVTAETTNTAVDVSQVFNRAFNHMIIANVGANNLASFTEQIGKTLKFKERFQNITIAFKDSEIRKSLYKAYEVSVSEPEREEDRLKLWKTIVKAEDQVWKNTGVDAVTDIYKKDKFEYSKYPFRKTSSAQSSEE